MLVNCMQMMISRMSDRDKQYKMLPRLLLVLFLLLLLLLLLLLHHGTFRRLCATIVKRI
jgi:hypothetical protein